MNPGYCITTRRFTLRCKHPEWLKVTQDRYNQVVFFYYRLLLEHTELHQGNNRQMLRGLEMLTIPGRDKRPAPYPLPWGKTPLYFRRAAVNGAIALLRSLQNRGGDTRPAGSVDASVVYYKGMYRELDSTGVTLKTFDGEGWRWMRCRLTGDSLERDGGSRKQGHALIKVQEVLSPAVVILDSGREDGIRLHVPVRETVEDARTAKERMRQGESLCSIQFTNTDAIAVACVLDGTGSQEAVGFFKGGKEYRHRCMRLEEKIRRSEEARGGKKAEGERTNEKYWMHLKHLSEHYAHEVSRELIDFCQEHEVSVIVLAEKWEGTTGAVMKAVGNWSPLHLSIRIREYLRYKAWKAGIVLLEVQPGDAGKVCAQCGAMVRKHKERYECANGHRGNRYLNTARNLGEKCRKDFERKLLR